MRRTFLVYSFLKKLTREVDCTETVKSYRQLRGTAGGSGAVYEVSSYGGYAYPRMWLLHEDAGQILEVITDVSK